jgi:hypothetical protein
MNYGLAARTILILLFNHSRPVTGLALLDHSGTIAVSIPILVTLADRYASSDRPHPNTHVISEGRGRKSANYSGNKQRIPHLPSSSLRYEENAMPSK